MDEYYVWENIHDLLVQGFSENELRHRLCRYEVEFEALRDELPEKAGKDTLVYQIIDYAHRQIKVEALLDWARRNNPKRYERHEPYHQQERAGEASLGYLSFIDDNHLGFGILLGGMYQDTPLKLAATEWARDGALARVRSGWLYVPQWTASHAIAFFKLHISDHGAGYIHIVDVAHPVHAIWLQTQAGYRREQDFHYIGSATDLWEFEWRETEARLFPVGTEGYA